MTKSEIIESTLRAMHGKWGRPLAPAAKDEEEDLVIQTLTERLSEGEYRTCADFGHLGTECCEACHTLYPHYEMHIEDLPNGGKAWICCVVRRALRGEKTTDDIDLEAALGGGVRKNRADQSEPA